jgi:hypothetical protein
MTLAPAVKSREPNPKTDSPVLVGDDVPIDITFDTSMDTSPSADSVISVDGCGASVKTPLAWKDDQTITGVYTTNAPGDLTITVHAGQAKSTDTGVPLDGNSWGKQQHDGAIAPNNDDFVWKVQCVQPYLTSVEYASAGAHFDLSGSYQTGPIHQGATLTWDETFDLTEGGTKPQGQFLGQGLQAGPPDAGGKYGSFSLSGKDDNGTTCTLLPFPFESPQLDFDHVAGSGSSRTYYIDVWMDGGTSAPFTNGCGVFAGTVNIPGHQTEVQFALPVSDHPMMHTHVVLANLQPLFKTLSDTDSAGQTTMLTQTFTATVTVSGYW